VTRIFVVHYAEVALKGNNRPEFVHALRRNIAASLRDLSPEITSREGRFFVRSASDSTEVLRRLSKVFGLAWFAEAKSVPNDIEEIEKAAVDCAMSTAGVSFKIDPRRSDKSFPMNSHELAVRLGSEVVKRTRMRVDLTRPDATVHVDLLKGETLVYADKTTGLGGLPVGTAGRVMHLFSGGIDSPVAAWLLMKRGCSPVYLHFYLAPTPEYVLTSKIVRLVKELAAFGGKSTLVLVPFADYQLATFGTPGELEPSLFRRFMRMAAEALAPSFGAVGVSTGDSLSQAASQTLWNLAAFDEGSTMPILRPLLSYDKEEIVSLARKIGTYDLSLEDYKDCCSMISRHPRTRTKPAIISDYAKEYHFSDLVWRSVDSGTMVTYNPAVDAIKTSSLKETLRRAMDRQRPMAP
jgi:thiamine biosynthesis protein ThiI